MKTCTSDDCRKTIENLETRVRVLEAENRRLAVLSHKDPLTGISNRRRIDEVLAQLFRALLSGERNSVSVLFIDLDNFKSVNDTFGHDVGDEVLCDVARLLTTSARGWCEVGHGRNTKSDITRYPRSSEKRQLRRRSEAGRYGGEEFIVIFEDAVMPELFAERIRSGIESLRFKNEAVRVTASIGVASSSFRSFVNQQVLLAHADEAMYRAKSGGKNRIVIADIGEVPSRCEDLLIV